MSTPREESAALLRAIPTFVEISPAAFVGLANLIDPTCHAEPVDGNRGTKCSECGTVWAHPDWVRYCPNCGARRTFETEGMD